MLLNSPTHPLPLILEKGREVDERGEMEGSETQSTQSGALTLRLMNSIHSSPSFSHSFPVHSFIQSFIHALTDGGDRAE